MHILMLMDIPFDSGSWIGRYMPIARHLAKNGHKISILMPNHEPKKGGYPLENSQNILIYETGVPFFRKIELGRKNYSTFILCKIGIQNIFTSISLLLRLHPDLMIVCKPLPIAATVGLFFKIIKGKKVVLDCDDAEVAINSVRSNFQRRLIHIFENIAPRFSDMILVNSDFTFKRIKLLKIKDEKIAYIPNGFEKERFSKRDLAATADNLKTGKKIILYYGDLTFASGHNVDLLLTAFKIFLTNYPNAKLVIIGDGKDEGLLKKQALDLGINAYISWKGRLHPEGIPQYLLACDVVVDPVRNVLSNLARCPVKIIEAMYFGKPVVTSDIGERRRILGDFGFYAKEGDPDSMALKLLEAINSDTFKKNRDIIIKKSVDYSWEKLSQKVAAILIKVAAR